MAIQVLSQAKPVSHLANKYQVSRKFSYQQGRKAQQAMFNLSPGIGLDLPLFVSRRSGTISRSLCLHKAVLRCCFKGPPNRIFLFESFSNQNDGTRI